MKPEYSGFVSPEYGEAWLSDKPEKVRQDRTKEAKPESPGVLEAFRRFEKSTIGRVAEVATAAVLGIGGADFMIGRMAGKDAWKEFQQHHPERSEINFQTMADVPETERETVMHERDNHYVDRVKDGLRDYIDRNLPRTTTPELRHALHERVYDFQKSLEKFRPSVYDRELTKAGLGSMVRTDRPFPVVRMVNLEDGLGGELGLGKGGHPDTIFIDTDPSNRAGALETMEHEYLHTTQLGIKNGIRVSHRTKSENLGKYPSGKTYDNFNEGANELLRGKLNALLGREFHPMYPYDLTGAHNIESTLGADAFWHAYAKGDYPSIEKLFNQRMGDKKFSQMFETGEGIITPFEKGK